MQISFYIAAAVMVVIGFLMVAASLLRGRRWMTTAVVGVSLLGGTLLLYPQASNYQPRSAAFEAVTNATTEEEALAAAGSLEAELMEAPDNFEGWRLLGRARLELNDFKAAEFAFRQALRLAPYQDAELVVMLGEALTYSAGSEIPDEAVELFLSAQQLAPNNPKALWYAGLAHAARGNNLAAAEAWEGLLATSPPPDVAAILSERIAALRGASAPPATAATSPGEVAIINLTVSLSERLSADWPASARLFVSVRDPERPGPPLAAVQYAPQALPLTVSLDDSDAMIAGRNISSAERYEIVARVSMSGDPIGGSGDLVGRLRLENGDLGEPLALVIDEIDGE